MPELPSGTVTLLFTDIESSTRLLAALGERYAEVLAAHRRLLREAFTGHAGVEVDTQGDAFFFAFPTAPGAIAAAREMTAALVSGPIQVRVGIHTGDPLLVDAYYVGMDLHRGARVMAAAHGGQVLVSEAARDHLPERLSDGIELRDLGEHRLKDLTEPERLFQLVLAGLESEFPPLKTLEGRPTNLPAQPSSLLGRKRELAEAGSILLREDVRLLTLTGPGGSGKTRLALQLGAELLDSFRDGVFFVDLAPVRDPALLLPTIAQTLALREQPGQTLAETLVDYVSGREMLLLLDNFEQVVEAAPAVAAVMVAASKLRVLATSRTPLHLSGELEYQVPPLELPDPTVSSSHDAFSTSPAVQLFLERGRAVEPSFELTPANAPAVAEICRRLDGLPLAIELAAVRVRLLPPEALLQRLDKRLKLLTGGARDLPARHQTLQATIEWSYKLLMDEEQALLQRLSVFAGGCTLDAAEAVCDPVGELGMDVLDGLYSLVEKNLLRQDERSGGQPRLSMLETIREFADEELEKSGDREAVRQRHAEYFVTLAKEAEPHLRGARQIDWLTRLDREQANLSKALAWALERDRLEIPLEFAGALWRFWETRATITDVRVVLDEALACAANVAAALRAGALFGTGRIALRQGKYDDAQAKFEESLALSREAEDRRGVALALAGLGWVALVRGKLEQAVTLCRTSLELARGLGEKWIIADALNNLGCALEEMETYADARLAHEESLALRRQIGELEGAGAALANLGGIALKEGELDRAEALLEESRTLAEARGDLWFLANTEPTLAYVALSRGDLERATDRAERSFEMSRRLGYRGVAAHALETLAGVAAAGGEASRAARLWGAAHSASESIGSPPPSALPEVHRWLEQARSELGESRWDAAFGAGRVQVDLAESIPPEME